MEGEDAQAFACPPPPSGCACHLPLAGEDKRRVTGFTLIEIMVALAVFSLAAMALLRLEGATLRSVGILDETLVARLVARDVAVAAVTDAEAPTRGRTTGAQANGGRTWRWVREVRATGNADVLRVDVSVLGEGGGTIARLTMIRPPLVAQP